MRRAWILLLGTGLIAAGLGCCRTLQHTAGVCDCNPPPVGDVLHPYGGTSVPVAPMPAKAIAPSTVAPPMMPQAIDPGK